MEKVHPPTTFEEWLVANNLDDWPFVEEDADDDKVLLTPEMLLEVSTVNDVKNEIKKKARIFFISQKFNSFYYRDNNLYQFEHK